MQDYLNDVEIAAAISFRENKVMSAAIRKILMYAATHQGVLTPGALPDPRNWAFGIGALGVNGSPSNEQLGEELKAALKGLNFLESGFEKLNELKVALPKKTKVNPAL